MAKPPLAQSLSKEIYEKNQLLQKYPFYGKLVVLVTSTTKKGKIYVPFYFVASSSFSRIIFFLFGLEGESISSFYRSSNNEYMLIMSQEQPKYLNKLTSGETTTWQVDDLVFLLEVVIIVELGISLASIGSLCLPFWLVEIIKEIVNK